MKIFSIKITILPYVNYCYYCTYLRNTYSYIKKLNNLPNGSSLFDLSGIVKTPTIT